jgi:ubiquinone/menaquinone biosynthesis C-methylase UbiE
MSYVMECADEAQRLEKMAEIFAYQPAAELVKVSFAPGMRVLDAGCGSGLVAKYIADTYPGVVVEGCDQSDIRMEQARRIRKASGRSDIRFFQSPLERIAAEDNTYDRITCRHVFEFLPDPQKVLSEFRRVLKPGGQLALIQFDGFIFNYHQDNPELRDLLDQLERGCPTDSYVGRKLPSFLLKAGFRDVDWDIGVYDFKGEDLQREREQMRERLTFALPALVPVFGTEERAARFRDLYYQEMAKPGVVLFYNKFLVRGTK